MRDAAGRYFGHAGGQRGVHGKSDADREGSAHGNGCERTQPRLQTTLAESNIEIHRDGGGGGVDGPVVDGGTSAWREGLVPLVGGPERGAQQEGKERRPRPAVEGPAREHTKQTKYKQVRDAVLEAMQRDRHDRLVDWQVASTRPVR